MIFLVCMIRFVILLLYIFYNKFELLEFRKYVFIKDVYEGKINFLEYCCYLYGWICEKNSFY